MNSPQKQDMRYYRLLIGVLLLAALFFRWKNSGPDEKTQQLPAQPGSSSAKLISQAAN